MCDIPRVRCSLGMSAEGANSRSTSHTSHSTFWFNGVSDALGFAWLASHLHLLFFLVLNKSSIKEEHLQIFSICMEEAKQSKCQFLLSVDNKYWLGCIMLSAALIYVLHFNHMLFKHL